LEIKDAAMTDTQTVLLPTGPRSTAPTRPAERPKSLAGLRIGLLDNGKEFSDVVMEALGEALRRDHGATRIKFWRKGFPAKGAPFIAEMAAETRQRGRPLRLVIALERHRCRQS
jgi:hypothetical protein